MRLIDADALGIGKANRDCFDDPKYADGWNSAIEIINNAPTIEAAPVRHGRWVMTLYTTTSKRGRVISNKKLACSECGYSNGRKQNNYCPDCGAKMDGDNHGNVEM